MLSTTLLALGALISLPLTAVGLPGTWAFIAGACLWKSLDSTAGISWTALWIAIALATVAEVLEWTLASRYTAKYGGSRRAGWGALIGGVIGAIVGVPIPVIGSIIGSFAGAFLGALIFEYTATDRSANPERVAWGALVGRVAATGTKVAIGVVVSVVVLASAIW